MLHDGLYEQIINKGLETELSTTDKLSTTAPIDSAEASKVLAKYIAEVVEKGLDNVADNGGDVSSQVALANRIISTIIHETKENELDEMTVAERAEQLLALFDKKNSILSLDEKAAIIRPETSIAQSSLFTGAIHEPQMFTQLKKEIISCNRIDMLVSFIKWSGLRLIMDELKTFTQNGGELRIITTSYMGATDVVRQQPNVEKMEMLGAKVVAVESGNKTLKDATNEAIRDWCCHPADTYYIIGSTVGPHPYPDMVARLQSVISEEIKKQLQEKEGRDYPDYLIACVGGGSNAAGTIYHYINDERVGIILAEAGGKGIETGMTAATIQLGKMGIIHGARTYVIQNEDGQIEEPYSISAGLDYPGIGPIHANLAAQRRANVLAINDDEAIEAAYELTKLEGIIPALESAHALGALKKLKFKPEDIVVLTVSGRGDKDIETYLSFNEQQ